MSRTPVSLRQAVVDDVPFLLELWSSALRRADPAEQSADLELVVKEAAKSAEQRLLVATIGGAPVGAVLLQVATISAVNLEPVVRAVSLCVAPHQRRQGVGRLLMSASVDWSEEIGVGFLMTGVESGSRAGNRFMARLALGPKATLRLAPTHAVRTKLDAMMPTSRRVSERASGRRQLGQVLAARRQLRRVTTEGSDGS